MASRRDLLAERKKELIAMGYTKNQSELALQWAVGCAEGMARKYAPEGEDSRLATEMLPQFLRDCPKWLVGVLGGPTVKLNEPEK